MSENKNKELIIPKMLGRPFYPYGFPLQPENWKVNGKSIREIYIDCFKDAESADCICDEDNHILKSYIIYYMKAPVFDSEYMQEVLLKDLNSMSIDELIDECLEIGLDPL